MAQILLVASSPKAETLFSSMLLETYSVEIVCLMPRKKHGERYRSITTLLYWYFLIYQTEQDMIWPKWQLPIPHPG